MNVLGIRDPSADSFPNEIARPIDSTSIIVFNVKPLQTCPCWCFSLRVPSVAADVLLSLCRSDYLYDIFLFIKLIVTCGANCLYTYHTAEVHTHYHPLLIFFLQLLLPTLIHLLVSKWEVTVYLALPFNLAALFYCLGDDEAEEKLYRLLRNFTLFAMLAVLVW